MSDEYTDKQRAIAWIQRQLNFERILEELRNTPEAQEARDQQDRAA